MASSEEHDFKPSIPPHLVVERTIPLSTPPDYIPPFPVYSAKFGEDVAGLTMAVIGAQFAARNDEKESEAIMIVNLFLKASCDAEARPAFMEWAAVTDRRGYYNMTAIAYWKEHTTFETWRRQSGFNPWWESLGTRPQQQQQHGWFLEIFSPSVTQIEAVSSHNWVPEGAGRVRESIVGPIREHAYWGSMRDRLPIAQTDPLDGHAFDVKASGKTAAVSPLPQRIRVPGRHNLAIIRSGQDWKDTSAEERAMYQSEMHPVLQAGMDFLRDEGEEVGCYSCRLMDIINPVTRQADEDRTFGLAFFNELASLEKWAKKHPTHLAIFGGFIKYAQRLNHQISLRLTHEVLVLRPEQQLFEYIGCHRETGMLVAAA
ncbi:Phenylacetaldoxime dehydratase [Escovopsis weberi]|uniref:Phenylacetaldoxime dehydratase n=1 Tax=Escovopsis weberi TaxID=150374 RepID=A0A0M9VRY6_ESCWE|nr:Phenylacetaldoxime dehydratase [Escovopsis weberi]